MVSIIKLIRPQQWVKNLFIFIPAFFAGVLFDFEHVVRLLIGFGCFSATASAIYIVNDFRDIEADRNHPKKKSRPLASGSVPVWLALSLSAVLAAVGLSAAYFLNTEFFYVIGIYFLVNMGYSLGLKNVSILDIIIVASGFLFRTVAGGLIIAIPLSNWLLIMIFLLALFLAMAKRLDDVLVSERDGKISRKVIKNYNLSFIQSGITLLAGVIIVSYLMYTISEEVMMRFHSEYLYFTGIFVVAGLMRYLQITFVEENSGSPTRVLLTDKFILITLAGWIVSFFLIIYR